MAGLRGLFVQRDASNNGTTPKGARLALGGLLAPSTTDPLSVRTGVLVDGMQAVVTGTGSMAYQVRGFVGVTKFTDANGPVVAANDAPVSVPTTPSPGSNSRIDRVWMIQRLITGDGGSGAVNVFEFGVTQGNVAASPTAPTGIPAGAIPLYDFTVTAGATSTAGLTAVRRHDWTVGNGGIVPQGDGTGLAWDGAAWAKVPLGALAMRILPRTSDMVIGTTSGRIGITSGWGLGDGDMGDASGITYAGGELTVSRAGLYRARFSLLWPNLAVGNRYCAIEVSSGASWVEKDRANSPAGGLGKTTCETRVTLTAGQKVRGAVEHSAATTQTITPIPGNVFELELLRPA